MVAIVLEDEDVVSFHIEPVLVWSFKNKIFFHILITWLDFVAVPTPDYFSEVKLKLCVGRSVVSNSLQPHRL